MTALYHSGQDWFISAPARALKQSAHGTTYHPIFFAQLYLKNGEQESTYWHAVADNDSSSRRSKNLTLNRISGLPMLNTESRRFKHTCRLGLAQ